jgi:hypothetical protein
MASYPACGCPAMLPLTDSGETVTDRAPCCTCPTAGRGRVSPTSRAARRAAERRWSGRDGRPMWQAARGATGRSAILPIVTRTSAIPAGSLARCVCRARRGWVHNDRPELLPGPRMASRKPNGRHCRPIGVPLPSRTAVVDRGARPRPPRCLDRAPPATLRIARRRNRFAQGRPGVDRPRILGDGTIALTFPWTDLRIDRLHPLGALRRGWWLLWDLDQGWEFAAQRWATTIIGERDWERDGDRSRLVVERTRFVAAADAARATSTICSPSSPGPRRTRRPSAAKASGGSVTLRRAPT